MKIGLSLVLYKEPKDRLDSFLENFKDVFKNYEVKILIFSNSQHDYKFPDDIRLYQSEKNLGYGAGHNHNYEWLRKNGFTKVIISNTDLRLEGAPEKTLSISSAALVSPLILNDDGENQKVTRSLPTFYDKIRSFIFGYPYFLEDEKRVPGFVPHVSGCFFLVNISIYCRLDFNWLFDPIFFLYEEDTDLCRRLYGEDNILHEPSLIVRHSYEKGSSSNKKLFILHLKSIFIYFKKWGFMDPAAIDSRKYFR